MKLSAKSTSPVYKIILCLVLTVGFVTCGVLLMKKNEIDKENEKLRDSLASAEVAQEQMKEELAAPFDAEYVRQMARKLLGYCMPGEVIFYTDVEED